MSCSPPSARSRRCSRTLAEVLGHLGVLEARVALGVDGGDDRVDAPQRVGSAGGGVLVGRLVQGGDGELDRLVAPETVAVAELDGVLRVTAARAGGVEVGLLETSAGDVVGEDATLFQAQVVAGEQRE